MCSFNFNCIVVGKNSDMEFKVKATDQIVFFLICWSQGEDDVGGVSLV